MNRVYDARNRGRKRSRSAGSAREAARARWSGGQREPESVEVTDQVMDDSATIDEPPTDEAPEQSTPSASRRKLSAFQFTSSQPNFKVDYIVVHRDTLQEMVSGLECAECNSFEIVVQMTEEHGMCSKVVVTCALCEKVHSQNYTSPRMKGHPTSRPPFEINRKIVQSCLSVGVGFAGLQKLCMGMGMQVMSNKSFYRALNYVHEESEKVLEEGLKQSHRAIRDAYVQVNPALEDSEILDIAVSFDGSWPKQGHNSMFGVGTVIDVVTGLVCDSVILSKYCVECVSKKSVFGKGTATYDKWHDKHVEEGQCEVNFDGTSNAMEQEAAKILWTRSEQKCKFRYVTMVADGDSKPLTLLRKILPYGPGVVIAREQCVNHVAKRMGAGLSNLIKDHKKKTGISLGGNRPGQLTQDKITKLQSYYRNAIVKNIPNIGNMRQAVLATPYHCASTDKEPRHEKCPGGVDSWCFYNRAVAKNEEPPKHDSLTMRNHLNTQVFNAILPVYERLSSDELMAQCARGKTTNSNEAFHSVLWSNLSKKKFCTVKRLEVNLANAILQHNMGHQASILLRSSLCNVELSEATTKIAEQLDTARVQQGEAQATSGFSYARKTSKIVKTRAEERRRAKEGVTYEAGVGDD